MFDGVLVCSVCAVHVRGYHPPYVLIDANLGCALGWKSMKFWVLPPWVEATYMEMCGFLCVFTGQTLNLAVLYPSYF